jgi:hypothetical protein
VQSGGGLGEDDIERFDDRQDREWKNRDRPRFRWMRSSAGIGAVLRASPVAMLAA